METEINNAMIAGSLSLAVSTLAKATAIAALGLIGTRMARRSRASLRHALLAVTFGALTALPFATTLIPPVRIEAPIATQEPARSAQPPASAAAPARPEDAYIAVAPVTPGAPSLSVSALLFKGWIAGMALFLLPMVIGLWQARCLRRSGLLWLRGQSTADEVAAKAGIRRRVEVLLHEATPGPMTCGIIRPAILLPPDARNWEEPDLTRAIVHEVEHVRRRDWVSHGLARAVCAVYWFHPLIWIARRWLALEAERACDDAVLGYSEATAYADQLVGLAERLSRKARFALPAMANSADLAARVRALLDGGQRRGRAGAAAVMAAAAAAILLVLAVSPLKLVAVAQSQGTANPAADDVHFEVATIKHTPPDVRYTNVNIGWEAFQISYWTVRWYIGHAYSLHGSQLTGGPEWAGVDRYDVTARLPQLPAGENNNPAEGDKHARSALRNLLAERFQLRMRQELRQMPVYALVVDKGGHKLTPAKTESGGTRVGSSNGNWTLRIDGHSMKGITEAIGAFLDRPLIDETGLQGPFDFQLTFTEKADSDPTAPTIFTAVRDQLGLRLEAKSAQIANYVIEKLERPSEN
jgi:uncharacterized protein (TIGR03435 family)